VKLTDNLYRDMEHPGDHDECCVRCREDAAHHAWSAAVKATLLDVARDLEKHAGRYDKWAEEALEANAPSVGAMRKLEAESLRGLAGRYIAASKGGG